MNRQVDVTNSSKVTRDEGSKIIVYRRVNRILYTHYIHIYLSFVNVLGVHFIRTGSHINHGPNETTTLDARLAQTPCGVESKFRTESIFMGTLYKLRRLFYGDIVEIN